MRLTREVMAETMVRLIRETEGVDVEVSERVEVSSVVNSTQTDMNKP